MVKDVEPEYRRERRVRKWSDFLFGMSGDHSRGAERALGSRLSALSAAKLKAPKAESRSPIAGGAKRR
jgi:hypothetical protein